MCLCQFKNHTLECVNLHKSEGTENFCFVF